MPQEMLCAALRAQIHSASPHVLKMCRYDDPHLEALSLSWTVFAVGQTLPYQIPTQLEAWLAAHIPP